MQPWTLSDLISYLQSEAEHIEGDPVILLTTQRPLTDFEANLMFSFNNETSYYEVGL
jgi:hypothetical protein